MLTLNAKRPTDCDLPEDVIIEILLRLPVKSLLRLKCVCKHWYTLIGSRSFVNQHFGHKSNQERLLIHLNDHESGRITFALYADDMFSRYEEPDDLQILMRSSCLLGPLNGVFCVVNQWRDVALLNPAMRQFKPLPLPHADVPPRLVFHYHLLGFGLDPLSGDYKLVWIQYFWNDELHAHHYPPLAYVFNLGNGWRHIENVDLVSSMNSVYRRQGETYLNEVYYWLFELDGKAFVLAFDMSREKFREIQVPDCIVLGKRIFNLSRYRDSMALLSYDYMRTIDVWLMENEGCWTKHSTVCLLHDRLWPLGFWKFNELLLAEATSVLSLNVSNQKLRTVSKIGIWRSWFFSYKESLVSIKREGDDCKLWDTSSDFVQNFFRHQERLDIALNV